MKTTFEKRAKFDTGWYDKFFKTNQRQRQFTVDRSRDQSPGKPANTTDTGKSSDNTK